MPRSISFDIPLNTSYFTPNQLQSAFLSRQLFGSLNRFMTEHLKSWRRMVREHSCAFVIASVNCEYTKPFTFFDADSLTVHSTTAVIKSGKLLRTKLSIQTPEGEEVARATKLLRPVHIKEDDALSGTPGDLPEDVRPLFQADEIEDEGAPQRVLKPLLKELEGLGKPVARGSVPFTVHRHDCEMADQWSFAEIPAHAALARETLAADLGGGSIPKIVRGLSDPMLRYDMELYKPAFLFDTGTIETAVWLRDGKPVFVHEFILGAGPKDPKAIVAEQF